MIRRISGRLDAVQTDPQPLVALVVPGSGLVLEVHVPRSLAVDLAASEGQAIELHTKLLLDQSPQQTSLSPRLLGFATADDRAFFDLFTSVKGVGPKAALKAMVVPTDEIARSIDARDAKALARLPGIGKRTAETVIAALHGKVEPQSPGAARTSEAKPAPSGPAAEAVEALLALGETRAEAEQRVERALAAMGEDETPTAEALIAAAFGHYDRPRGGDAA